MLPTTNTTDDPGAGGPSTSWLGLARGLLVVDLVAAAGGTIALLLARVWTAPVSQCGGTGDEGLQGAAPLWVAALGGLLLAVVAGVTAIIVCIAALVRSDGALGGRGALALLASVLAGAACIAGGFAVFGDTPLFCF
jgi:hypothetical protein